MIHFRLYAVPVVQEPTGLMSHLVLLYYLSKKLQHFNELASRVGVLPLKSECKVIAFFNTSKIF